MTRILIVGGVAGGATAAARLRRLDEDAEIIVFERGGFVSFANCGLPYYVGGVITNRAALLLQTPQGFYNRYRVEVRLQHEVTAVDPSAQSITVKDLQTGESRQEGYDKLVLAPGASPTMPEADADAQDRIFSLHTIPDMDAILEIVKNDIGNQTRELRAAVIGGGFIGLETAENLVHLGLEVTLVQRSGQVMPPLDPEMAGLIHTQLKKNGVNLLLNSPIQGIHKNTDAQEGALTIELANGSALNADFIVAAIGVKPLVKLAKEAGLKIGQSGGIFTDEHMRTSDPNIYAVGDAVELSDLVTQARRTLALAGPANKQARIAADNICSIPSTYKGGQGSSVIKVFDQTVALTGINEKTAMEAGLDYDKVYLFAPSHATYFPGAEDMTMKMLFEKPSGRILGVQIVGQEGVDKRCDAVAIAIRAGLDAQGLAELELCYAPPYSSAKDPVNTAAYMISNLIDGRLKQFHWHDVAGLPRDGSVTLLDVRTVDENAKGAIEGFKLIPVDELRERLGELDPHKPVFLHCQSGLRSYIASRILIQNGFEASHLCGGYRLYKLILGG